MSAEENSQDAARVGGNVEPEKEVIATKANTRHEEEENDSEYELGECLMKRGLSRKLDLRLCTIAGILCSLNLVCLISHYYFLFFLVGNAREADVAGDLCRPV
jgi:hypothetical protein